MSIYFPEGPFTENSAPSNCFEYFFEDFVPSNNWYYVRMKSKIFEIISVDCPILAILAVEDDEKSRDANLKEK